MLAVPTVSVTVSVTMAAVAPGGRAIWLTPCESFPLAKLMVRVSRAAILAPPLSRES